MYAILLIQNWGSSKFIHISGLSKLSTESTSFVIDFSDDENPHVSNAKNAETRTTLNIIIPTIVNPKKGFILLNLDSKFF